MLQPCHNIFKATTFFNFPPKSSHMLNLLSSFKLGRKRTKSSNLSSRGDNHIFPSTTNSKISKRVPEQVFLPHSISVFQLLLEGKEVALNITHHIVYLRLNNMPYRPNQIPIFVKQMYQASNTYVEKIAIPWVNHSVKSICLVLQKCMVEMQ